MTMSAEALLEVRALGKRFAAARSRSAMRCG